MNRYLALDIGGTYIKYGLLEEGTLVQKGKLPVEKYDIDKFLKVLDDIYHKFQQVDGICISMPGCIEERNGIAITGGHLKFINNTPLKNMLEKRYGRKVHLANDGHCACAAEVWKGSLRHIDNGAVMVFGSGIAGGLVIGGTVLKGSNYASGEFSCIVTNMKSMTGQDFFGYECSTKGMLRSYHTQYQEELTGEMFFKRVVEKEERACSHLEQHCEEIASVILTIQAVLDLQRIAIGGGISEQDIFLDYIKKAYEKVRKRYGTFPIYQVELVPCEFHNDANLLGAYYFFKKSEGIEC